MIGPRGTGIILGLISSATFGLIPLFTLPLMKLGITPESALFYRFLFAAIITLVICLIRRDPLIFPLREMGSVALMSLHYSLAALFLFLAYLYLPSGIASTIQFSYPIMVMLIMILFYKEELSKLAVIASILALGGVSLLSCFGTSSHTDMSAAPLGILFSLGSALTCAIYVVSLCRVRATTPKGLPLLFYLFLAGAFYVLIFSLATGSFRLISSLEEFGLAAMLAITTAIIANLTLVWAVARIGSTLSAVLGAMEPLTAVTTGILVFNEPGSLPIFCGIALIIGSVCLIMAGPWLVSWRAIRHAHKKSANE